MKSCMGTGGSCVVPAACQRFCQTWLVVGQMLSVPGRRPHGRLHARGQQLACASKSKLDSLGKGRAADEQSNIMPLSPAGTVNKTRWKWKQTGYRPVLAVIVLVYVCYMFKFVTNSLGLVQLIICPYLELTWIKINFNLYRIFSNSIHSNSR
jgi:hypothetical protein